MKKNEANWSYSGRSGPEHWGELDEAFALCEQGQRQSPVDIRDVANKADKNPLTVRDTRVEGRITERPTTLGFEAAEPVVALQWENRGYSLREFHFHVPSEHTLRGDSFPMEGHFVHQDTEENVLVLGVYLEPGSATGDWKTFRERASKTSREAFAFSPADFLPDPKTYYAYEGSLTTPPCDQGIQWVLLEEPVRVDSEWIEAFQAEHGPNNRPLQDRNGRAIYRYSTP